MLAAMCSSYCIYSSSEPSAVAYVWTGLNRQCYQRVATPHPCLTTYAEEQEAVIQWMKWDSCRTDNPTIDEMGDVGLAMELLPDQGEEERCRGVQPPDPVPAADPEQLQPWEIEPRLAYQMATAPPGEGVKMLCREASNEGRLRKDAPLCSPPQGYTWPEELLKDFENSKVRRLSSTCRSTCLYSQRFSSHGFVWHGSCYQVVSSAHSCFGPGSETERQAVMEWLRQDSCKQRFDSLKAGHAEELRAMRLRYNATAGPRVSSASSPLHHGRTAALGMSLHRHNHNTRGSRPAHAVRGTGSPADPSGHTNSSMWSVKISNPYQNQARL